MSVTSFPVNDLLRRKLQTALTVVGLTLCVASTVFLLLFGDRVGVGVSMSVEGKLTAGFSSIFSPFIIFLAFLIFIVGIVIISFTVFVMMSQRVKDIGLMRAVGCPNNIVFGYFMTELLIVTVAGCLLGAIFGIVADIASVSLFQNMDFQISQKPPNLWIAGTVSVLFFILALVFGAKPVLNATKIEPAKASSPTQHLGLAKEPGFRVVSKSGLTFKIAMRSLSRRASVTIRIVACLSTVFLLVTVAVAGGIIADQTTRSWVEKATGKDVVLIAHRDICSRYRLLQSKFYETKESSQFNYTEERFLVPDEILSQLGQMPGLSIDTRLLIETQIEEVPGFVLGQESSATTSVGDHRKGLSLVVGVEPEKVLGQWFMEGAFLREGDSLDAVVGDTEAQKMFTAPLYQNVSLFGKVFHITGVCLDPINNGNVTYVPLESLQRVAGVTKPNIVMIRVESSTNRTRILEQINAMAAAANSEFETYEVNESLNKDISFLGYIWSTIMFLPLFALAAASLCLIGYVMLTIAEQRQEFGILRAIGVKPRTIVEIVSGQSFVVLLSSYAAGVVFGIIITLLILVPEPVITEYTVFEIAGWLVIALATTFILSLYPAIRFARKPVLEMMTQI
jgi:ABC-type antimicrobial peptide transport system permease subunit